MRRRICAIMLAGGMAITATACGQQAEDEMSTLLVQEEEEAAYPTTTAEYGDIVKDIVISCKYTSTEEQDLSFPVEGGLIELVEVELGDYVTEGQLLAALDVQDLEDKIEEAEYQVKSQELKLKQTEEMRQFELDSAQVLYEYTYKTNNDKLALAEKKESIENNYKTTLEDMRDALSIQKKRLQQYREELADGQLFAGMTGEITYVRNGMVDTYSQKDQVVITVSNEDACYFISDNIEYADNFQEGVSVNLVYREAGMEYSCEVVPAMMDSWDEQMYFKPVGDEIISINADATIALELERKENVLCVPASAIHKSDSGLFVYLEKDGLLEMRYVTVGVEGATLVEITDGLEQGEIIALKR